MANHSCFRCGALLDSTCGKDAQGRWLCGACWEKRSSANAKVALHQAARHGNDDVTWWRAILEELVRMITGRRRW